MSASTTTTTSQAHLTNDIEKSPNLEKPTDNSTQNPSPEDEIKAFGPAPDGGFRAWLNAAAGFAVFFSCLGFTSCFGVLQEYYSTHQLRHKTQDDIAWIGSLASFIQFAGGAVGGPLFDRFGVWVRIYLLVIKCENGEFG